jgi:hypothetical protein
VVRLGAAPEALLNTEANRSSFSFTDAEEQTETGCVFRNHTDSRDLTGHIDH